MKLVCRAKGHPKPKIIWRREDGKPLIVRPTSGEAPFGTPCTFGSYFSKHIQNKIALSNHIIYYLINYAGIKVYEGEELRLRSVKRRQAGAYLCIAKNFVPPAVSKRIQLNINCELLHEGKQMWTFG